MVKKVLLHVKDQRLDSDSAGLLSTGALKHLGVYSLKEELRHADVPTACSSNSAWD